MPLQLTVTMLHGLIKQKYTFLPKPQKRVWHKKKDGYNKNNLISTLKQCWLCNFIDSFFSKGKINTIKEYLTTELSVESRFPDLNHVGNVWYELKRRVDKRLPRILDNLERSCKEKWSQMYYSLFFNPMKCFRRRLSAVLVPKGRLCKVLNAV